MSAEFLNKFCSLNPKQQLTALKRCNDIQKYKEEVLYSIVTKNKANLNVKTIEYLIACGASVLTQDPNGNTLLHIAVKNDVEYIKSLLYTENSRVNSNQHQLVCSNFFKKNGRNALFIKNNIGFQPKDYATNNSLLKIFLFKEELKMELILKTISVKEFSDKLDYQKLLLYEDLYEMLEYCLDSNNITELMVPLVIKMINYEVTVERRGIRSAKLFTSSFLQYANKIKNMETFVLDCNWKQRFQANNHCFSLILSILYKLANWLNNKAAAFTIQKKLKEELKLQAKSFEKLLKNSTCHQIDFYLKDFYFHFNFEEIDILLNRAYNNYGDSYLHYSVTGSVKDKCIVKILIEHGAIQTKENGFKNNPLHVAALNNDIDFIYTLVKTKHQNVKSSCRRHGDCFCGIQSLFLKNDHGKTAKMYCGKEGYLFVSKEEILHQVENNKRIHEQDLNKIIANDKDKEFFCRLLDTCITKKNFSLATYILLKCWNNKDINIDEKIGSLAEINIFMRIVWEIKVENTNFFKEENFKTMLSENRNLFLENMKYFVSIGNLLKKHTIINILIRNYLAINSDDSCTVKLNGLLYNRINDLMKTTNLSHITKIYLKHNFIKNIDPAIFHLNRLQELDLSHNKIKNLPENIIWSDSLSSLNVSYNELCNIPKCIQDSYIKKLDISNNQFQTVPVHICNMRMLNKLILEGNINMSSLPIELGKLPRNCDVHVKNMIQLPYKDEILQTPIKLMRELKEKLYQVKSFNEVNVHLIGDSDQVKKHVVMYLFGNVNYHNSKIKGVTYHGTLPCGCWSRKKMHVIEFPDIIKGDINNYMHHGLSLYLYVYKYVDAEIGKEIEQWFNCLSASLDKCQFILLCDMKDCKQNYCRDQIRNMFTNFIMSRVRWKTIKLLDVTLFNSHTFIGMHGLKKFISTAALAFNNLSSAFKSMGGKEYAHLVDVKSGLKRFPNSANVDTDSIGAHLRRFNLDEDTYLEETVAFLKKTGEMKYFTGESRDPTQLFFLNKKWFNKKLVTFINLAENETRVGSISRLQYNEIMDKYIPNLNKTYFLKFLLSHHICFNTIRGNMQIAAYLSNNPPRGLIADSDIKNATHFRIFTFDFMHFELWIQILSRILLHFDNTNTTVSSDHVELWKTGFVYRNQNVTMTVLWFNPDEIVGNPSTDIGNISIYKELRQRCREHEYIKDKNCLSIIVKPNVEEFDTSYIMDKLLTNITFLMNKISIENKTESIKGYSVCLNCFETGKIQLIPCNETLYLLLKGNSLTEHSSCGTNEIKSHFPEFYLPGVPHESPRNIYLKEKIERHVWSAHLANGRFEEVVVKRFENNFKNISIEFQKFKREVLFGVKNQCLEIKKCLKAHPNIVRIHAISMSLSSFDIILERANQNLRTFLFKGESTICDRILQRPYIFRFAFDIINGIKHIHSLKMSHNDIKSKNVLIFFIKNIFVAKLCDFGEAKEQGETAKDILTIQKKDIWCFAVVLYEMIFQRKFFDSNNPQIYLKTKDRPSFTNGRKDVNTLCQLTTILWQGKSRLRPNASALCEMLLSTAFQLYITHLALPSPIKCVSILSSPLILYIKGDPEHLCILNMIDKELLFPPILIDLNDLLKTKNEKICILHVSYVGEEELSEESTVIPILICYESNDGSQILYATINRVCSTTRCAVADLKKPSREVFHFASTSSFQPRNECLKRLLVIGKSSILCCYDTDINPLFVVTCHHQPFCLQEVQGSIKDMVLLGSVLVVYFDKENKINFYKIHQTSNHCRVDIFASKLLGADVKLQKLFLCKKNLILSLDNKCYFINCSFSGNKILNNEIFFNGEEAQNVTCNFQVHDTVWLGTSLGNIFIYRVTDKYDLKLLKCFQPYKSQVLILTSIAYESVTCIVSYGVDLNDNFFNVSVSEEKLLERSVKTKLFTNDGNYNEPGFLYWLAANAEDIMLLPFS